MKTTKKGIPDKRYKDKSTCVLCRKNPRVLRGTIAQYCLSCYKEKTHGYYVSNKAKRLDSTKRWMKKNPEKVRSYKIIGKERLKALCFSYYGGAVCRCCGESEIKFLVLDHKKNNGSAERRLIFGERGACQGGSRFYSWLKLRGFPRPEDYQVLCNNCNRAKFDYKICPHQQNTG